MSYNGSGTFQINTSGQPVVTGTVISSSAFNALTADLATGLSTAITKDGQTATTVRIPFAQGINSSLATDTTSGSTGSIFTAGGVGITKSLFVGGTATFSATPIFSALTASSAVATDASKNLVSVANTGTGSNVLATSPTLVTPVLGAASATSVTVGAGAVGTPSITTTGDTNTGIFFPAADTIAFAEGGAEAMRIDSSGNLGIGVTPSAWNTNSRVLQIGVNGYMGLENYLGNSANVWANLFRTSPSVYNYLTTAAATLYSQSAGQHTWYNAPSGTAGNSATLTQAMTLDNSGNLGIGTTTIAAGYGGGNGSVTLQNAKSLAFNNASNAWSTTTTGAAILYFTDNNLYIDAKDSTANIIFRVNGATERMRIDSSGNVLIGVTSANANGGVLQLKSGITFPATQVAATDANTLDDYEEGTWTPTIEFGGASVGLTYASQLGRYTKIGNQVTVWFDVRLSAKGSSTGNVTIPGLPFVINSNSRATGIGDPIDAMTGLVAGGAIILQAAATTSFIYLFQQTTTARGLMGSSNFNNTSAISGSITYFV